jgi:fructose-1,6-bisphosphatase/inositol monophosphatase family enzyme
MGEMRILRVEKLGVYNSHQIGIIMKELVRRAIVAIRSQKQVFEVQTKRGYTGEMDDVLTSADRAAQEIYIKSLRECFPLCGIISEEDSFIVPCRDGSRLYFSVDPLDGTKAFVRRQSHGVGTMISLSCGKDFIAAYIGDINTQEIYGFRPGSRKVHRITELSISEELNIITQPLSKSYVMLRNREDAHSPLLRKLIRVAFKDHVVDGGSVGIWMARLWKGEIGAALFSAPLIETPWDANPINAISLRLGFCYLRPSVNGKKWVQYTPKPLMDKYERRHEVLVVHKNNLSEIL